MWNEPTLDDLAKLPRLYETEDVPSEEKLLHMHFFLGSSDWYAAEYGPSDRLFYGYAILNGDRQNAEWSYFALDELRDIRLSNGMEIDRDLYWETKTARDALGDGSLGTP